MALHQIQGKEICEWNSFHDVFSKEFDFPDYYGRNMNAWIDCMSELEDGADITTLFIQDAKYLKSKNLEIYEAILECSAFVNFLFVSQGGSPVLALAFHE